MSETHRPLDHLARGLEELLRAAADALALWRDMTPRAFGPTEALLDGLVGQLTRLLDGDEHLVRELRDALRREVERWELRAGEDPAARRVRELFAALLDLLDEADLGGEGDEAQRPRRSTSRVPPRRKPGKTAR